MLPTRRNRPLLPAAIAAVLAASCAADQYDPPAGYYASATGTGASLKSQLHNIIDNHTVRSYGDARSSLQITDRDPADPDRMLLVYDRTSIDVSAINPNGSIPGWDSAATWNREHTWPRSRGVFSSGPDNSDLHQLRPSDTGINEDRGSLNFGGAFGQPFGEAAGGFWYPGDADAGMIARQQFYMAVRYDGSDSATTDLELSNGNTSQSNRLGDLASLLDWHFRAPPDDFERRRNQVIYDDYQGNRNPFIDRPELAWSVLVDQQNDSQITIAGGTADGSGGSTLDLDLGAVFVGGALPSSQNVVVDKAGLDGTYYAVTTSGAATSSVTGTRNAFRTGTTDNRTLSVGLDADTSSPGQFSGSVTIDNLDITTGGGAGRGADDDDDAINLSFTVLDHATASFDAGSEVIALSHDFGQVAEGDAPPVFDFALHNLGATPEFTSDLEVLLVTPGGDADHFSTSLMPLAGEDAIAAGQSRAESAMLLTDTVGAFSATYTLAVADIDLPGREIGGLTLTLTGEIIAASLAGDFNGDGAVDAADYTTWRDGLGVEYTLADFQTWRANFGEASPGAATIPEPGGLLLAACLVSIGVTRKNCVVAKDFLRAR